MKLKLSAKFLKIKNIRFGFFLAPYAISPKGFALTIFFFNYWISLGIFDDTV